MKRFINLVILLSFFALCINAQDQVSEVPLKNKNEARVAYNRAIENIKENNFTVALEYLSAAIDLNPEFAEAYLLRGKTNLELGKKDDAIRDFEMAIEKDMNLGEAYFYRGYTNLSEDPDPTVIADFDRAITKGYKEHFVYYYRGLCKLISGDYTGAILDLTSAIDLQSAYALNYQSIETPKRALGDVGYRKPVNKFDSLDQSLEDIQGNVDNLISTGPDVEGAQDMRSSIALSYHERGTAKRFLGDYQGAVYDYRQAANYKPDFPEAFNNMGSVKIVLGDFQGAVDDYTVAIRLDTSYYMAYNNRGSAKFQLGDYNGAMEDFNKVISIKNSYGPALNNIGGTLAKLDKLDESLNSLNQAITNDQSFGYAYLNRGLVKELMGDLNGACDDWKMAGELGVEEAVKYLTECK